MPALLLHRVAYVSHDTMTALYGYIINVYIITAVKPLSSKQEMPLPRVVYSSHYYLTHALGCVHEP
jgi:hypothetical protein